MLISLDEHDPRPLYAQVVSSIKEQIQEGTIHPGDELPSVRELAASLGVNLHTIHQAYRQLRDLGVIHLRLGRRARVAALRATPAARDVIEARIGSRLAELATEAFHLGLDAKDFRRLVNDVARDRLARRQR
jgi:GntR family transcriptional regulator